MTHDDEVGRTLEGPAPEPPSAEHGPAASEAGRGPERDSGHFAERLGGRLTQQFSHQWGRVRAERRGEEPLPPVTGGVSNFSRAQVPWGLDLAAAWSWRVLIIGLAVYVIAMTVARFSVVTMPLAIALLLAALVSPLVRAGVRVGLGRKFSSLCSVILTFGLVGVLLTFAGQQVVNGANDLANEVVAGLDKIRVWLREGPLNASDSQINDYISQVQEAIREWSKSDALGQVTDIGTAVGHVTAGFFIVLFAMYFFLADGARIWSWVVRLSPSAARTYVDSSGKVAWVSLTQFVRATVVVAFVDAVGIMAVAAFLGLPFILAIGVLVFLGAFVPLIGATVAGGVAVLVALVDQGPLTALFMLIGVIVVQQIEGNVLQPFLMGRFVAVHPLGVLMAIGCGLLLAGVAGALVAVPLVAAVNAVVLHLAGEASVADVAETEAESESPPEDEQVESVDPERNPA